LCIENVDIIYTIYKRNILYIREFSFNKALC